MPEGQSSGDGSVNPIVIAEQGSYFCGGTVDRRNGQVLRVGHAYVQYQVPVDARPLPLVLVHGGNGTGKTWETTSDGREGFQTLLVRQGFSVYIVDLPGRGRAAAYAGKTEIPPPRWDEAAMWNVARWGQWVPPAEPTFFETLQLPADEAAIDQRRRMRGVSTLPWKEAETAAIAALSALVDRIGPCVMVTSSAGGALGWLVGCRQGDVRGIVSYEPARFAFPDDDIPPPVPTEDPHVDWLVNELISRHSADEFARLAAIPIQLVYGDNIATEPSPITGVETWRVNTRRAAQFVDVLQRHGGDAEIVYLPDKGLHGNTHGAFNDLNNVDIARLFVEFLTSRGLA
jgi:pimeloyl-ACP methyl ester carboxylesterase